MRTITFYFDFISPYAWLAFKALPRALEGHAVRVIYQPILFAGLLKHFGQMGPAEIAGKRDWTYRQVLWLAHKQGASMKMPAAHPFNPLGLLRLALASDESGHPERRVCEVLFDHAWTTGADPCDPAALEALRTRLQIERDPQSDAVRQQLRVATDAAVAAGVFGVPTCLIDGNLFWGQDALPMLSAYLAGDPWFASPAWTEVGRTPVGVVRR